MTVNEVLKELKGMGSDSIKKVLLNHGIREPFFGVKVGDMKNILKRIKKDYRLALELYDTGNYDAMYLAGLIADDAKMTKKDLGNWADKAYCGPLAAAPVAWVAVGSPHGHELALQWIESKKEFVACAGWETLGGLVAVKADGDLDLDELKSLLSRVQKTIQQQPNRVRSAMNHFVIAVGSYVAPLTDLAIQTGEKIGEVSVDVGDTACSVPYSPDYIQKAQKRGAIGRKRKTVKC
jgi:3-methyladenine DNA glycosylase AlkD